jgi:cobalamin biosynthesis protein CobT
LKWLQKKIGNSTDELIKNIHDQKIFAENVNKLITELNYYDQTENSEENSEKNNNIDELKNNEISEIENQTSFSDSESSESQEEVGFEDSEVSIDQENNDEMNDVDEGNTENTTPI